MTTTPARLVQDGPEPLCAACARFHKPGDCPPAPARPDGAGAEWVCIHHEDTCKGETCCCADTHLTDPQSMAAGRAYIASDHDPDSEWQAFLAGFAAGAAAERARAERQRKALLAVDRAWAALR